MKITTCHECGREGVRVDPNGFLAQHSTRPRGRICNGSGRHEDFNRPAS
ncbi:MAG TPA: hypothetical protein VK735_40045 [Pseudonocardia sp.]|nr:hypothetical protein [Pseudonocardia sp.]HTF53677.1 hypothetical protein [Pseudonocardia sp.]